jgi:hypothetical protein
MAGKNDYGFNAEEAINSIRPDTPKRQSREIHSEESSGNDSESQKSAAIPTPKKTSEKKTGKTVQVGEYLDWLKGKTDFNSRTGKSCNIRQRYHYRIAKLIGLLGDKNLSISTYVDMVLGEHLKKYDEAMDAVMKMKFDEMQAQISNEE